jgi:hypothetical protein
MGFLENLGWKMDISRFPWDPQSFQLGIFCLSSFIQIIYLPYIPIFSSVLLMVLISFSCSLV